MSNFQPVIIRDVNVKDITAKIRERKKQGDRHIELFFDDDSWMDYTHINGTNDIGKLPLENSPALKIHEYIMSHYKTAKISYNRYTMLIDI